MNECDVVPGSLGGYQSTPWCRMHERYAASCEAVHAALARVRERVEALDASATCRCDYRAAILAIIDEAGG